MRVEKALFVQAVFQLLKGVSQLPHAIGHHVVTVKLIHPVPGKHRHPTGDHHLHPIFRTETQRRCLPAKHHAANAALGIFQGEVVVARGVNFIVGNFTAHQHLGEQTVPVQQAFDVLVEGSDGNGFGHHGRLLPFQMVGSPGEDRRAHGVVCRIAGLGKHGPTVLGHPLPHELVGGHAAGAENRQPGYCSSACGWQSPPLG